MGLIKKITKGKDAFVSQALKIFLENYFNKYGNILDVKLNTHNKNCELVIQLRGESSPVTITVGRYEIISEGNKTFIRISDISTTREWIDIIAQEYLENRKLEVKDRFSPIIKILV